MQVRALFFFIVDKEVILTKVFGDDIHRSFAVFEGKPRWAAYKTAYADDFQCVHFAENVFGEKYRDNA